MLPIKESVGEQVGRHLYEWIINIVDIILFFDDNKMVFIVAVPYDDIRRLYSFIPAIAE